MAFEEKWHLQLSLLCCPHKPCSQILTTFCCVLKVRAGLGRVFAGPRHFLISVEEKHLKGQLPLFICFVGPFFLNLLSYLNLLGPVLLNDVIQQTLNFDK